MKLIAVRALSALALTTSLLAGAAVSAHAQENTDAPVTRAGDTSRLTDVDPSGFVGSIDPAENAGLLNYCVQNEYVDYDDGWRTLQEYNKKTNAVPEGQEGSMPYANGSAGLLHANNHTYTIAMAVLPVRQKTCKAVLERAKASL
ncbi:hypothetical protein [Acetobacter ascendens]|uniref:DUF2501 domain-containing protein n=1 Tax=Acetobacter ascendens TaxID=481146 RepID=A0A1D8QTK5_9PROT|nr:hypothetical protein [Acetobacter ascendens]RCL06612.1 DUF2501 domain-containing protein [Acetobacter pasteurianus]GCD74387.1 PQQ-dependent alcohol dehydrogenase small subunit [Acetobacter pasteurianus NBRC 3299]AOW45654.1 DUF2501 domain-containing protein [Acetobacter ascendens]AOW50328.1 DUF2501 domain-containing protein [Acetobacter ascendens]ARW09602.1 hypothetical protein S101447_00497 [Acetobacter ascendens]